MQRRTRRTIWAVLRCRESAREPTPAIAATGEARFVRFARTPALKVVKTDPLAAHHALLDTITDKNMHDVVAYLETLK